MLGENSRHGSQQWLAVPFGLLYCGFEGIIPSADSIVKIEEGLLVYDEMDPLHRGLRRPQRETRASRPVTTSKDSVDYFLGRVTMPTYLQSEDPVWFLLREFRVTSRTEHGFISAFVRDISNHVKGLGSKLAGRPIASGADVFPASQSDAE